MWKTRGVENVGSGGNLSLEVMGSFEETSSTVFSTTVLKIAQDI